MEEHSMTEDGQGRVTLRDVYQAVAEFRAEVNNKFEELPKQFASIEAVNAHGQRLHALETSRSDFVPNAVHDICQLQVQTLVDDMKKEREKRETLERRVWFISGGAAVIGAVASPIISSVLNHL